MDPELIVGWLPLPGRPIFRLKHSATIWLAHVVFGVPMVPPKIVLFPSVSLCKTTAKTGCPPQCVSGGENHDALAGGHLLALGVPSSPL